MTKMNPFKVSGMLLLILTGCLVLLSHRFNPEIPILNQPVWLVVLLMVCAGGCYGLVVLKTQRCHQESSVMQETPKLGKQMWIWVLGVGAIMRITMLFSTPILEVDFNRYLWDGAVLAEGLNPYAYAPLEVQTGEIAETHRSQYQQLADESGEILHRINHGHLRTIYPPITQSAFALAHLLKPWSLTAWRLVLLGVDALILIGLYRVIRHLGLSPVLLVIYWWNPLMIKEVFNSGHMDILLFPLILAAVLWVKRRPLASLLLLALAVGIKLWPIALVPLFLRYQNVRWDQIILRTGAFAVAVGLVLAPQLLSGQAAGSGLIAFGESWQLNDGFFKIMVWCAQYILPLLDIHPGHKYKAARIIVAAIFAFWVFWQSRNRPRTLREFVERCLWVTAALFILIPTEFPWYSVWFLPFLVVSLRPSLLLYSILLPLYYLRYHFDARGEVALFDTGVVWFEHIPVWILLLREWVVSRRSRGPLLPEVAPVP